MNRFFRCRWLVCLSLLGSITGPASAAEPIAADQPLLFNSIEFRGPAIGGWNNFSRHIAETLEIYSRCAQSPEHCPRRDVVKLMADIQSLRSQDPTRFLSAVNRLANRRPYRLDHVNFGQDEYWASPLEFLSRSGDCEDFAIFKYALLRHLGMPAEALRVVLVKRSQDELGHAVLAAYLDGEVYILDNASQRVLEQSEVADYTAVFSFNEEQRWAHFTGEPGGMQTAVAAAGHSDLVVGTANSQVTAAERSTPAAEATDPARPTAADWALSSRLTGQIAISERPTAGSSLIQLGAFRVAENAPSEWRKLERDNPDLLGGLSPRIDVIHAGTQNAWHILRVGPVGDELSALSMCAALRQRDVGCLVVKADSAT